MRPSVPATLLLSHPFIFTTAYRSVQRSRFESTCDLAPVFRRDLLFYKRGGEVLERVMGWRVDTCELGVHPIITLAFAARIFHLTSLYVALFYDHRAKCLRNHITQIEENGFA